jgi:hypothetical protein
VEKGKMKNKKLIALLAVALIGLAIVLSGCSSNSTATPTITVTETETEDTYVDPVYEDEDIFLAAVRVAGKNNYFIKNAEDYLILDAGWAVCEFFDSGFSLEDAIYALAENNPSNDESYAYGIIIGAAVTTLCPEYEYIVG